MSDFEVRKARMEVEKSVADFEKALDLLLGKIERGADRVAELTDRTRDIKSKVREMVDIDAAIFRARESASELISDIRSSAEQEIKSMDLHPLMSWSAVLVSGFTLGYILGRKLSASAPSTSEAQSSRKVPPASSVSRL